MLTKTCHHITNVIFDRNSAKTHCAKNIACTALDTRKESSPQAISSAIKGMRTLSEQPPAGPKDFTRMH